MRPLKRWSRRAIASSSGRQRTDFDATRIGLPPARASISSAFNHMASRSTNANGASLPSSALSYRAYAAAGSICRLSVAAAHVARGRARDRTQATPRREIEMIEGINAAIAALSKDDWRMDALADDAANVNTTGFKAADSPSTQGALVETGQPLDL